MMLHTGRVESLPPTAISYYEAAGVSVLFELPLGTGRLIYIGYDFAEPVTPWVHTLVAATRFTDYDFKGVGDEGGARARCL